MFPEALGIALAKGRGQESSLPTVSTGRNWEGQSVQPAVGSSRSLYIDRSSYSAGLKPREMLSATLTPSTAAGGAD
jgi:hypothetical protein